MKYSDSKIKGLLYKYLTEEHPFKSDGPGDPYVLENYEGYISGAYYAILDKFAQGGTGANEDMLLVVWEWPDCHDVFIIHPDFLECVKRADF